jgi:hypothetical protein
MPPLTQMHQYDMFKAQRCTRSSYRSTVFKSHALIAIMLKVTQNAASTLVLAQLGFSFARPLRNSSASHSIFSSLRCGDTMTCRPTERQLRKALRKQIFAPAYFSHVSVQEFSKENASEAGAGQGLGIARASRCQRRAGTTSTS